MTGVSIRLLAPDDNAAAIGQMEHPRPRQAIEQAPAWVRGEITMSQARTAGGHAMAAARDLVGQHVQPRRKEWARAQGDSSAGCSAISFRRRFASS